MFSRLTFSLLVLLFTVPFVCAQSAPLLLGSDVLALRKFEPLRGKRVGLITNPSGVNRKGVTTTELLRAAPGVKLVALFGPEHGYYGLVKAGNKVDDGRDAATGLPVYSLYGHEKRRPQKQMLKGIDVLVYDLQDIGCRSYTYISTMGLAMDACGEAGIEFMVLDRPNPMGGHRIEGSGVEKKFKSFVSQYDIPYLYGMTCGELAKMINGERWMTNRCNLTVIPMQGWKRELTWAQTGLSWVQTSPILSSANSAFMLMGTGILGEVGGVHVGNNPGLLRYLSAPWLDPREYTRILKGYQLPGINFRAVQFKNASGKLQTGTELRISDPQTAPLVALNYYLIEGIHTASGRNLFGQAAASRSSMFDKVSGTDQLRKALEQKRPVASLIKQWDPFEEAFRVKRQKYLLY